MIDMREWSMNFLLISLGVYFLSQSLISFDELINKVTYCPNVKESNYSDDNIGYYA
jgi:hypothetical protein